MDLGFFPWLFWLGFVCLVFCCFLFLFFNCTKQKVCEHSGKI